MERDTIRRLAAVVGMAAALAAAAQTPPAHRTEMLAGAQVSIGADGKVTAVEPDARLPEGIRTLMRNRVMQWQYAPTVWLGKSVATQTYLVLRLEAVPTTAGGFVLRVLGLGSEQELETGYSIDPPTYPREAQKARKGGTFYYVADVDAQGHPVQARLVEPADASLDKYGRMMAEAGMSAAKGAKLRPFIADGVAVDCEWLFPLTFSVGEPTRQTPEEKERIGAIRARLARGCPFAALQTKIENSLL